MSNSSYVLTVSCPDRMVIVANVSRYLFDNGCNVVDSGQYGDPDNGRFFLRISFTPGPPIEELRRGFEPIAANFAMAAAFHDSAVKTRTLIMVSKLGHCLVDLLYRHRIG